MEWEAYRAKVDASRRLIVFPFFEKYLAAQEGLGVDIGCGSGDLTARIAQLSGGPVVGIDSDHKVLKEARREHGDLHFVCGEVDKNILPAIGLSFNYAFSNCCFCHVTDEGIYNVMFDLYSCMKVGGRLIFLVPSISWAKKMYGSIEFEKSGITAIPRYGGRQFFRTRDWYMNALHKCGFEVISAEELPIPNDPGLEERYRDHVGENLFSAFVARRLQDLPNVEPMKEAFGIAHENRKLEIQLFWQRSLFFWGFVAAALVGYGTARNANALGLEIVFGLFGLVCSVVWSAGNRGSKYWQEYWEQKVNFFQHYTTGNIFYDRSPISPKFFDVFAPRRMSVSKLTMALSDYSVLLWLVLCTAPILKIVQTPDSFSLIGMTLLTLVYCLWFLSKSKSED